MSGLAAVPGGGEPSPVPAANTTLVPVDWRIASVHLWYDSSASGFYVVPAHIHRVYGENPGGWSGFGGILDSSTSVVTAYATSDNFWTTSNLLNATTGKSPQYWRCGNTAQDKFTAPFLGLMRDSQFYTALGTSGDEFTVWPSLHVTFPKPSGSPVDLGLELIPAISEAKRRRWWHRG